MTANKTSNKQLIANLRFIGANYPNIAPVQTVGVMTDCMQAAMVIEKQEKEIERLSLQLVQGYSV